MRSRGLWCGTLALASVLVLVPGATAQAAGPTQADRQASHAAARLAHLQQQLQSALSDYDAALNGLGQQVSEGIQAEDAVTAAQQATQVAENARTQQVRALYMSGGQIGVYASLLSAGDPQDLALRVMTAEHVVASADDGVELAAQNQVRAEQAQALTAADTDQAVVFADDVTARAQRVDDLVAATQATFDRLSATARHQRAVRRAAAALARARSAAAGAASSAAGTASAQPIPADYLALYHSAARTCSGMSWTLLAAVGQVESGHGRHNGPSSAGAIGPMQFRPRTFAAYAVDGDHDGRTDPWDPADAIFTAAHFLCSNGGGDGPVGVQRSLLHYNNAQWYVDLVLAVQQRIAAAY